MNESERDGESREQIRRREIDEIASIIAKNDDDEVIKGEFLSTLQNSPPTGRELTRLMQENFTVTGKCIRISGEIENRPSIFISHN